MEVPAHIVPVWSCPYPQPCRSLHTLYMTQRVYYCTVYYCTVVQISKFTFLLQIILKTNKIEKCKMK